MYKRFVVEHVGTPQFKRRLARAVRPYTGNPLPIRATLKALRQRPYSSRTVVFEYDYVDKDYQSEFSTFYSLAFKKYPPRCVRLHFFNVEIPKNTTSDFRRYSKRYLGFIVIRPTDLQRMGRTVLRPPVIDRNKQFIHCLAEFPVHILGEKLAVRGMPFVQQDSQVGACAQASLWMLARYMSRRFGFRDFLPAEINQLAKAHMALGRPLPAERGLNFIQILDALEGMGLPSVYYAWNSVDDCSRHIEQAFPVNPNAPEEQREQQLKLQRVAKLADIAYRYIESSLPVIFGTADHAFVGIGHTYEPSTTAQVAIQRIPAFFINNDNTGPYVEMRLFPQQPELLSFLDVRTVIVVSPREVTLRGEEAEAMARRCVVRFLNTEIPGQSGQTVGGLVATEFRPDLASCLSSLEFRTFLRSSVEFQADLRQDIKKERLNATIGDKLLRLDYPKYIWITEVSSSILLNKPKRKERRCLGRVIIDSTAPAKTRGQMVIHIADFLQLLDRQTGKAHDWEHHPHTTPFAHKLLT